MQSRSLISLAVFSFLGPACRDEAGGVVKTTDGGNGDGGDKFLVDGRSSDAGSDDGGNGDRASADGTAPDGSKSDRCALPADCPGGTCWQFPDGHRDCVSAGSNYATDSCQGGFPGCCMKDSECAAKPGGRCVSYQLGRCGGAVIAGNGCRYDECATDADCNARKGGACIPAGAFGAVTRACLYGPCRFDGDCRQKPGGRCQAVPFFPGCGPASGPTLFCSYDGDPCKLGGPCSSTDAGFGLQICGPRVDLQGTECQALLLPP